ncbi:MAG: hypothetical protein M0C28_28050 [Candidatus Moduliflexus flocculans]|nr:hypothetical protein [Candidatus Moduliflexus flocculans]
MVRLRGHGRSPGARGVGRRVRDVVGVRAGVGRVAPAGPRGAGPALRRRLAGGAALALGLSAVAWRPAADVLSRSPRRHLPEDIRTAWSLPPHGLLRLVVPLDPARVPFEEEAWRRLYDRPAYPFLFSLYLGLPTLALGAAAVAWRTRRARALVLLALALLALGFALGPHGPVYPILTGLAPPPRVFRYPSKALLLVALATSLAAGLGVGALARRGVSAACGAASGSACSPRRRGRQSQPGATTRRSAPRPFWRRPSRRSSCSTARGSCGPGSPRSR